MSASVNVALDCYLTSESLWRSPKFLVLLITSLKFAIKRSLDFIRQLVQLRYIIFIFRFESGLEFEKQ